MVRSLPRSLLVQLGLAPWGPWARTRCQPAAAAGPGCGDGV